MSDTAYEVLSGRYELHRRLATGGSAEVFLGRDQVLNRPVAVKVLSATLSENEAFVTRLRREAELVASLNHQNIVSVFDQGEHEGAPFIVMEYVDGRSLADILRTEGRLHPDRAATIAVDVAAALDAAHRQGMVHMDVKPGNVLITGEGQVKLADFGIAKALNAGAETDLTNEDGMVMGTATYLSPEQAQGQKVGPRSDVYSLAVVLYEMMTGRPPFVGDGPTEIARKQVQEPPPSPRENGADIAQSLEAITLKALAKSPANRYPSVRDFAADLKRYLGGAHNTQSSGQSAKPPVVRPVTGRSTPPEVEQVDQNNTAVMPAQQQAVAASQAQAPVVAQASPVQQQAAVGTIPQEQPQVVEQQPVVVQRDDTWKRNILFFLALLILLLLLGVLARAFLDVLQPSDDEPVDGGTPSLEEVETVELQNFTNFDRDQAIVFIESQGLRPEITFEPNTDVAEGRVFSQDPPPGARVEVGSIVRITVSEAEGRVEVPFVANLNREEAERQLERLGFVPDVIEIDNDVISPGAVISQDPTGGTSAERGAVIFLEVSLGPSERTIPDLSGVEFTDALNTLFELDFRTSRIDEPDPDVEEGLVLRTEPEAGSLARGREVVTIFVSSGVDVIPVPSVEGLLVDSARQQLVALGFEVLIDQVEVEDLTQVSRVVAQSPPANIELSEGDSVTIVVGIEPLDDGTDTTIPGQDGPDTTDPDAAPTTPTTEAPAAPTTTEAPATTTEAP